MRDRNLNAVQYSPDQAPTIASEIPRYIESELLKIQAAINALSAGHLDKSSVAPTKPREGDIRFADGTNWNPSVGKGIYYFDGAVWKLLG